MNPCDVVRSFVNITQKAYQGGSKTLMEKLPLKNEVLLSASALDPRARGHEVALHALLKLPKLVTNVAAEIDRVKYEREVRFYQVDQHLPSPECAVDWSRGNRQIQQPTNDGPCCFDLLPWPTGGEQFQHHGGPDGKQTLWHGAADLLCPADSQVQARHGEGG